MSKHFPEVYMYLKQLKQLKDRANGFNSLQNKYRRQSAVDKGFIQRPLLIDNENIYS